MQVSDLLMTEAICSYSRGGEVGGRGEVLRMIMMIAMTMIIMKIMIILMITMMSRAGEERTLVWSRLTVLEAPEVSFDQILVTIKF